MSGDDSTQIDSAKIDSTKIDRLHEVDLFRLFDRRALDEVARITKEVRLPRGSILCEQGRVADACWIIVEGEAEVEVGDHELVAVVGPGESVGEMGLLDHLPRSATVTARTDVMAYRIDAARFDGLLGPSPLARAQFEHGRRLVT